MNGTLVQFHVFQNLSKPFKKKLLPMMNFTKGSNPQTITTKLLYHFSDLAHRNGTGHFYDLILRGTGCF